MFTLIVMTQPLSNQHYIPLANIKAECYFLKWREYVDFGLAAEVDHVCKVLGEES